MRKRPVQCDKTVLKEGESFACIILKVDGELLMNVKDISQEKPDSLEDLESMFEDQYGLTLLRVQAKKNLADMKIIVDSIWDILETFRGDIKAVYILSNDCDFNPLIYKLKSLDIVIKAASFDSFGEINSVNGLLRLLTVKKFLPIKKEFVTQSVYEAVSDAVKEERVDKTVILALVRDRYTILQKAVKAKYGFPMDNLSEKQLKCFSFWDFNRFLTQRGVTSSADLLKLFLTKVYGSTINDREISEVLKI